MRKHPSSARVDSVKIGMVKAADRKTPIRRPIKTEFSVSGYVVYLTVSEAGLLPLWRSALLASVRIDETDPTMTVQTVKWLNRLSPDDVQQSHHLIIRGHRQ